MKNLIYILIFLPLICIGQTISINGSLHSTNGDNTFPIWVEEGTTIQPNFPIYSISLKEFNIVPNANGNDLVFNKTVLVYSDSISTVPEGKTWKLESIQNGLQVGDEYAGGIIFYLDGNGGGKVFASGAGQITDDWSSAESYCESLNYNGYTDWYFPDLYDVIKIGYANNAINYGVFNNGLIWSNSEYSNNAWFFRMTDGTMDHATKNNNFIIIPIRQF